MLSLVDERLLLGIDCMSVCLFPVRCIKPAWPPFVCKEHGNQNSNAKCISIKVDQAAKIIKFLLKLGFAQIVLKRKQIY